MAHDDEDSNFREDHASFFWHHCIALQPLQYRWKLLGIRFAQFPLRLFEPFPVLQEKFRVGASPLSGRRTPLCHIHNSYGFFQVSGSGRERCSPSDRTPPAWRSSRRRGYCLGPTHPHFGDARGKFGVRHSDQGAPQPNSGAAQCSTLAASGAGPGNRGCDPRHHPVGMSKGRRTARCFPAGFVSSLCCAGACS